LVGTAIQIGGEPTTVVGVLPSTFKSDPPADIFIPLQADPNSTDQGHYLRVAGRLKPGVTLAAARAQMKVVGERFRQANPKWMDKTERLFHWLSSVPAHLRLPESAARGNAHLHFSVAHRFLLKNGRTWF